MSTAPAPAATSGALGPFRHVTFVVLWTATLVSNIGTWIHDVGAGWLMTQLSPSPLLVSLVQAATALPIFLFAIPAGALADIADRRRLLIWVNALLGVLALILGLLVAAERIDALTLLAFTFIAGIGAAMAAPAWQALVADLVPRSELPAAVALNSMGINIARAIGPAVGGVILTVIGLQWPFLLNAVSFLAVILALLWWKPPPRPSGHLPAERFLGAARAGLRYVRESAPLRATLARSGAFFVFASAYWALLPLIARDLLQGGPAFYGLLLAAVGGGAVAGAFLLPRLKAILGPDRLVAAGTAVTALVLAGLALGPSRELALAIGGLAGAAWISVLSSLNVSAQVALPQWVRARGLAVFITAFFGAMTLGSVLWGHVATWFGIPVALLAAATGAIIGIAATWPFKLQQGVAMDLTPSMHWPEPIVAGTVESARGPVMVTVEYVIDPQDRTAFGRAVAELSHARRRDGAFAWGLFEDAAQPGRYLEYFMEESWLEHQRHHERVTKADAEIQAQVAAFHRGEQPPRVTHLLGAAI